MANKIEVGAEMVKAILRFGYCQYSSGISIADASEGMRSTDIGEDHFYFHLRYLSEAGFIVLHDIGRIDLSDAGIPTTQIGRSPGYQITGSGIEYLHSVLEESMNGDAARQIVTLIERSIALHENTDEQIESLVSLITEGHKQNIRTIKALLTSRQEIFEKIVESIGKLAASHEALEQRFAKLILNLERSPRVGFDTE